MSEQEKASKKPKKKPVPVSLRDKYVQARKQQVLMDRWLKADTQERQQLSAELGIPIRSGGRQPNSGRHPHPVPSFMARPQQGDGCHEWTIPDLSDEEELEESDEEA